MRDKDATREMDKGREKRKRVGKGSQEERKRKVKEEDEPVVATKEEVDEFFAILKRMQEAAEYFGKGNNGPNGVGWQAAVEAEVVAVVGGGRVDKKGIVIKGKAEEEGVAVAVQETSGVLDLNIAPEVEDNDGT